MFDTLQHKISERLHALKPGQVVVLSDFEDISEAKTTSKILTRLSDLHLVDKLMRGMFFKKTAEVKEPTLREIAEGIARANGWHIAPCGDTALYALGILKNKPTEWTFVSDGTNRSYQIGEQTLVFKHTAARYVSAFSQQTATIVQALKAIGPHITPERLMEELKPILTKIDFKRLAEECKKAPAWIAALLISFCTLYENMNGIL